MPPPTETLPDAATQRDIAAYYAVHDQCADAVREKVMAELREDPVLAGILEQVADDPAAADAGDAALRDAVHEGRWEPFLDLLREQGRAYATLGLRLRDWFRVVNAYRTHVVPHVIREYGDDGERLAAAIRGKSALYDLTLQTIGEAYLTAHQETIDKQRLAIEELSTPVLQLRPGLLLLPVVGVIDSARSRQLTEALLDTIRRSRARVVVMDITGVAEVDSEVANRLVQAAEAARLMGAMPILTGISAGVAQTLVALGVDLRGLRTIGDLQGGIEEAERALGVRVVTDGPPRSTG